MPAPQLATASITDRIQALSSRDSILPFEVRAVERDIERLMSVSAAEAYMLSGMLQAALGEYEKSKDMHLKGLRLVADEVSLVNFGISMRRVGRLQEAKTNFLKALERSPGSVEILEKVVNTLTFLCDYEGLEDIIARFRKANSNYIVEDMKCMETFRSIESHLTSLNIPFSEFKMVGAFIERVMNEFDLVNEGMLERLSNFDGVPHLYLEISLPVKNAQQLVSVNERIAELVLECDDISSWDKLVVNFVDKRTGSVSAVA